jgi:hypothetical protein
VIPVNPPHSSTSAESDEFRREERSEELSRALAQVRERIARACDAAGRSQSEVDLVAVTKTFPAEDVALLGDLGVTDVAENRDQEATAKVSALSVLRPNNTLQWHMIGHVQRNKARSVVGWASQVQSVDSPRIAEALARAVAEKSADTLADKLGEPEPAGPVGDGRLDVLLQVSLDGDLRRGGCPPDELPGLAEHLTQLSELRLRGLMTVAPREMSADFAFDQLVLIREAFLRAHPEATELSAGMSGDLEQAVAHGATRVRVGTALLGGRGLASPEKLRKPQEKAQ